MSRPFAATKGSFQSLRACRVLQNTHDSSSFPPKAQLLEANVLLTSKSNIKNTFANVLKCRLKNARVSIFQKEQTLFNNRCFERNRVFTTGVYVFNKDTCIFRQRYKMYYHNRVGRYAEEMVPFSSRFRVLNFQIDN